MPLFSAMILTSTRASDCSGRGSCHSSGIWAANCWRLLHAFVSHAIPQRLDDIGALELQAGQNCLCSAQPTQYKAHVTSYQISSTQLSRNTHRPPNPWTAVNSLPRR